MRRKKSKNAVCDGMTTTAVENSPMMREFQSSFSCDDHHPLYVQLTFLCSSRPLYVQLKKFGRWHHQG